MYVIATVICPNFHFSVSPHVPFLNLLFEQIANSNAYLLAKFGFDTAEKEPCKVCPTERCSQQPWLGPRGEGRLRSYEALHRYLRAIRRQDGCRLNPHPFSRSRGGDTNANGEDR